MLDRCSVCGEFIFEWKKHKCKPAWWCWISDGDWDYEEEDGKRVHAVDAKDAATEYIEQWDNGGDYVCIGGNDIVVSVKPIGEDDNVQTFTVHGEMVPEYYAEEC